MSSKCKRCNGKGGYPRFGNGPWTKCKTCHGSGVVTLTKKPQRAFPGRTESLAQYRAADGGNRGEHDPSL